MIDPFETPAKPYFTHCKRVTLGDTNAFQNVYFAKFFDWQGQLREEWMAAEVSDAPTLFQQGYYLSTKSAHMDYIKPLFAMDMVECRMYFADLGLVRVKLMFEFWNRNTGVLCAHGWQLVVFKDARRKTCAIPESFLTQIQKYLHT